MRNTRTCLGNALATGASKCQIDFGKVKAIVLVEHGQKITTFSVGAFKTACHADRPARIYPIKTVVEYAKNGGEPQTSAVGYGGTGVTGYSARTDVFTLDKVYEGLAASLTENKNKKFDAYYLDDNNLLIGLNDGTDVLAGIPMSCVFPTVTHHATSGAKATMTVSCCLEDAEAAIEKFDYKQLAFNPIDELEGLVKIDVISAGTNKWKVVETVGGYDRTAELGSAIATGASTVLQGATSAEYTAADETLSITPTAGSTITLAKPSVLAAANIFGVEYNKTVAASA